MSSPFIIRTPARGAGYASKTETTNWRITFNTRLAAPDMGFRTFRPGRNTKDTITSP